MILKLNSVVFSKRYLYLPGALFLPVFRWIPSGVACRFSGNGGILNRIGFNLERDLSLKKRGIQMQEVKKVITEVGTNEWQVVVFFLGEQSFAINVDKTREILRWPGCRVIPDSPKSLIGITSVRGEVLRTPMSRLFQ